MQDSQLAVSPIIVPQFDNHIQVLDNTSYITEKYKQTENKRYIYLYAFLIAEVRTQAVDGYANLQINRLQWKIESNISSQTSQELLRWLRDGVFWQWTVKKQYTFCHRRVCDDDSEITFLANDWEKKLKFLSSPSKETEKTFYVKHDKRKNDDLVLQKK